MSTQHAPFIPLDVEDAFKTSIREGKRLLVATAPPGGHKHMNQTTWVDPEVVSRMRQVIAIQIEGTTALDNRLGSTSQQLVTLIMFSENAELDRVVGNQSARMLLDWFDNLASGLTWLQSARNRLKQEPSNTRLQSRLAAMLTRVNKYDEALIEYVSLWHSTRTLDRSLIANVPTSDLQNLLDQSTNARSAFVRIRDSLSPNRDLFSLEDWLELNYLLREQYRSVEWFNTKDCDAFDSATRSILEANLVPILIKERRFSDAGILITRPSQKLAVFAAAVDVMKARTPDAGESALEFEHVIATTKYALRHTAASLVGLLTAARRYEEASAITQEALKLDPSEEMEEMLDSAKNGANNGTR